VESPSAAFEATPDRTPVDLEALGEWIWASARRSETPRPLEEVATDERAHDRLREEPRRPIGIDLL